MGGVDSDMYRYFKVLMLQGFLAARKHMEQIVNVVDIMQTGNEQKIIMTEIIMTMHCCIVD